jgi:hypothetical protein
MLRIVLVYKFFIVLFTLGLIPRQLAAALFSSVFRRFQAVFSASYAANSHVVYGVVESVSNLKGVSTSFFSLA